MLEQSSHLFAYKSEETCYLSIFTETFLPLAFLCRFLYSHHDASSRLKSYLDGIFGLLWELNF